MGLMSYLGFPEVFVRAGNFTLRSLRRSPNLPALREACPIVLLPGNSPVRALCTTVGSTLCKGGEARTKTVGKPRYDMSPILPDTLRALGPVRLEVEYPPLVALAEKVDGWVNRAIQRVGGGERALGVACVVYTAP